MVGHYGTVPLKGENMSKRQFKFVNAGDVQDLIFKEVCKVLEMTTGPARYQFDGVCLSIRTRDGAPRGYALEPPSNWKDLVYALDILESIFDTKGWTRSIQRDDGVIFIVGLGYAQREAVQVVY